MGQSSSASDAFIQDVEVVHEEIFRHARFISEIALLSYDDFVADLGKLNSLSNKCLKTGADKQIIFAVKKGTDETMLWKGTVRIACVKRDLVTKKVESYRLLSLVEFLRIFKTLECQVSAAEQSKSCATNSGILTASSLFETVETVTKRDQSNTECCICLERKPDVILPCAHSYCMLCIEQWNVNHKTCPICRETLVSTDDTWVLSDMPEADEISEEIRSSLMKLVEEPSSPV